MYGSYVEGEIGRDLYGDCMCSGEEFLLARTGDATSIAWKQSGCQNSESIVLAGNGRWAENLLIMQRFVASVPL